MPCKKKYNTVTKFYSIRVFCYTNTPARRKSSAHKKIESDEKSRQAYTTLIEKLIEFARERTRVTASDKETDNPKYAFRCFLLRLGFIGAEYKRERAILLRNLEGNGAFKSGSDPRKNPA